MIQRSIRRGLRPQSLCLRCTYTLPSTQASLARRQASLITPRHVPVVPRHYSTATSESVDGKSSSADTAESTTANGAPKPDKSASDTKDAALKGELDSKTREALDWKDKFLRSVADFRNLQERTKRDIEQARTFALERFAKDLMESVDNLDRAINTVDQKVLSNNGSSSSTPIPDTAKELNNLFQGLKMTDSIMMSTLKKYGIERYIPVQGEKFNSNMHEATFTAKLEGKEDGSVFQTIQNGYSLNGRVLRAAKVGVVKNA